MEESINREILNEVERFLAFKNPNNFDEYFIRVLPKSSKI